MNTVSMNRQWVVLGLAVAFGTGSGIAVAQYQPPKECYTETGERYKTWAKHCPPGQTEVKTRIVSCQLPDGSRAFGNQCPKEATQTDRLEEDQLAKRSSGASSKENTQRTLYQARQREYEEQRAERAREWEARQAQAEAEAQRRQEEQAAAEAARIEAMRPRPRVRGN